VSKTATKQVTITNSLGLHARPAMVFVELASQYEADITVCRCDNSEGVDGKSIMQMMMLAATRGTDLRITASGDDAQTAVESLVSLVKTNFNEE
jgi:phosphocarrier protein